MQLLGEYINDLESVKSTSFEEYQGILAENGWISADVRDGLVAMAGFRNVLVHDYATIEDAIVFGVLRSKLPDLRAFGAAVLARLDEMDAGADGYDDHV